MDEVIKKDMDQAVQIWKKNKNGKKIIKYKNSKSKGKHAYSMLGAGARG